MQIDPTSLGICKSFQKQSALTPALKKLRSHHFQAYLTESKVDLTKENAATELLFFFVIVVSKLTSSKI